MTMTVPVYDVRLVKRRGLRISDANVPDGQVAARVIQSLISDTDREHFVAVFLDGRHNVTGTHVIAIGGQHGIGTIEARTVFRAAIAACASAIVLGHNHPSGDPTPSNEDWNCTRNLVEASKVLGIPIVDHVIVTKDHARQYSMVAHGTMPL